MKNHFKLRFLGTMLLLAGATTLTSCIFSNDDDLTKWDSVGLDDALPKSSNSASAYSDDLFSLTHSIEGNWKFNCSHELNQNGGFIISPLGSESSGDILAYTSIAGSEKFLGQKTLVFAIKGEGQNVILSVTDSKGAEKHIEATVTSDEEVFELFIGSLDLTGNFKVEIKSGGVCNGDIVFRDIHFTSILPGSYPTPYIYDGEHEMFLIRDYKKHWEINYDTVERYDDIIQVSSKVEDPTDKFIKTTVAGSEELRKFKTLIFNISSFKYEGAYNFKIRVGSEERMYSVTSQYSTTITDKISLENIDVTQDFDIYIYPKSGTADVATNLKITAFYITPYETTPVYTPLSNSVNVTANPSYHWQLGDNVNEQISFENDRISTEVLPDSSEKLRLYSIVSNFKANDFRTARAVVRGVEGNQIKYTFISNSMSYTSDTDQYATLTGEEQELTFTFPYKWSATGVCFYPNLEGNVPGTFEIISIVYEDSEETLNLGDYTDLAGPDIIDLTDIAKDHWIYEGDTVSVDENGVVSGDYTTSVNNPVSLVIKRSPEFYEYKGVRIVYKGTNTLCVETSQEGSSSSGMRDVTGYIEAITYTVNSSYNFYSSNFYFSFSKWLNSNASSELTIYKVFLVKGAIDSYDSLSSYADMLNRNQFNALWNAAHETRVESDGVVFKVPANSEPTLSQQYYRCTENTTFSKVVLEFDAPSSSITLDTYVPLFNSEPVTITPSMTSCEINLTKKGSNGWLNYNYYNFGIITSSTSNQDVNLKIKSISLIKAS